MIVISNFTPRSAVLNFSSFLTLESSGISYHIDTSSKFSSKKTGYFQYFFSVLQQNVDFLAIKQLSSQKEEHLEPHLEMIHHELYQMGC